MRGLSYNGIEMPIYQGDPKTKMHCVAMRWECSGVLPDGRCFELAVDIGFKFDGASTPRWLWWLCGDPMEIPRIAAALAHDWLYAAHVTDRETSDMIFRYLCVRVGMGRARSGVEYGVLRLVGRKAWKSHGTADESFARAHGVLVLEGETMKGIDKQ